MAGPNRRIVRGSCDRADCSRSRRSPPPSPWSCCRISLAPGARAPRASSIRRRSSRSQSQRPPANIRPLSVRSIRRWRPPLGLPPPRHSRSLARRPNGSSAARRSASRRLTAGRCSNRRATRSAATRRSTATGRRRCGCHEGRRSIICGNGGCIERVIGDYGPTRRQPADRRPLHARLLRHLRLPILGGHNLGHRLGVLTLTASRVAQPHDPEGAAGSRGCRGRGSGPGRCPGRGTPGA